MGGNGIAFYATPRMSRNQIGSDGSLSQGWTESTDSLPAGLHWAGQRQSKSETKLDFPRRLENMKAQKKHKLANMQAKKHRKKKKNTNYQTQAQKRAPQKAQKKPQTAKHDFRQKKPKKPIERPCRTQGRGFSFSRPTEPGGGLLRRTLGRGLLLAVSALEAVFCTFSASRLSNQEGSSDFLMKPIEKSTNRKAQAYPQKKRHKEQHRKKAQTTKHTHKK